MVYLHKESSVLYRMKGTEVQHWHKDSQRRLMPAHNPTSFACMVHDGVIVRVGKWPQRIYGMRPKSKIPVPDCAPLRYLLAQVPT